MSISKNIQQIKANLPIQVTLVAVSKTKPVSDLVQAYDAGQRVFGENKIQEMVDKYEQMPKDIQWHMIGHVQTNKVKYMIPFVSLIHGVDSLKLLQEINKQSKKLDKVTNCLLQMHIATEDTKFGLNEQELEDLLCSDVFKQMQHVKIIGLMGMASFTPDLNQVKTEFTILKSTFEKLKNTTAPNIELSELSMGMSGDYEIAITCGSTMVRIGSTIFGGR